MSGQEQQRVTVGPGNAHFMSIRQVSADAATLRRGSCEHAAQWHTLPLIYAAATAAAAAVYTVSKKTVQTYFLLLFCQI